MGTLPDFNNITWCAEIWQDPNFNNNETRQMLNQCMEMSSAKLPHNIEEVIHKSNVFPLPFPIENVRLNLLKAWIPVNKLKNNIISTYPIIHERVLLLISEFLCHKREHGSDIERLCYKYMTIPQFINRLLFKRSASFMGSLDWFQLLTGEKGMSDWENVGTSNEKPPLLLENCLSYDEMKISAMISTSGYTICINDGNRNNNGVVDENNVEREAVIIALVGPRFLRRGKMDYEDIIITNTADAKESCFDNIFYYEDERAQLDKQSKEELKRIWAKFYQTPVMDINNIRSRNITISDSNSNNYTNRFQYVPGSSNTEVFDNQAYYRRISMLAETVFVEAEIRAAECGRNAFINVVGCGLGTWMLSSHQSDIYILTFIERTRTFLNKNLLNHVTDVNFAFIQPSTTVGAIFRNVFDENNGVQNVRNIFLESESHPNGGINVQMEDRQPTSKLVGRHEGKLLVVTYPGDSNALPGNEFWYGSLNTSGGSATACSTQISELHNAHINPAISGYNLRVVGKNGIKTLSQYCLPLIGNEN